MRFTITRQNLHNGLVAVSAAVPSKTTLPVLSNILIETEEGGVRLSGTDLDTAVSVRVRGGRAEALCFALENGKPRSFLVRARRIVCAMPLFVAARVVEDIAALGFDARRHMPAYAPWMVTNFLMRDFPREQGGAPLAWDNVVYGGKGLGYVVSTHQDIRVRPPEKTVFTAYMALADRARMSWWVDTT